MSINYSTHSFFLPNPAPVQLSLAEKQQWQAAIGQANYNNIFCHCQTCDRDWIASEPAKSCDCGSNQVEWIACWQFPDD
jgi:hypothetical protein